MDPILLHQIQRDEGREPCAYKDSRGFWTIGDGICVDPRVPGAGLRPEEMDFITNNRLRLEYVQAAQVVGAAAWHTLSAPRQRAVINMVHNLGVLGLLKFHLFLGFLRAGAWDKAAAEMMNSKWAFQVGDGPGLKMDRAERLAKQIETGVDQ